MKSWFVTTPMYQYTEYVEHMACPSYDIADFEEVEAETRREAVQIAVRKWLTERDTYCHGRKSDGLCPWTGVRAESVDECKAAAQAAGPPEPGWIWTDDPEEWGWYPA